MGAISHHQSLNLLVAEDWSVRLTDFGLSRFDIELNQDTMVKIVGTAIWCPPEMYVDNSYFYVVWDFNGCLGIMDILM